MIGNKERKDSQLPLQFPGEGVFGQALAASEADEDKLDFLFRLHLSVDDRKFLIRHQLFTLEDIQETIIGAETGIYKTPGLTEERLLRLRACLAEFQTRDPDAELKWALSQRTY